MPVVGQRVPHHVACAANGERSQWPVDAKEPEPLTSRDRTEIVKARPLIASRLPSFRPSSGGTRLASTCHALSADFGGQPSPRRPAPVPSSSAATGQFSCGVAFSCPVDEWGAIGEQAALQPFDQFSPGPAMKKSQFLLDRCWSAHSADCDGSVRQIGAAITPLVTAHARR